MNTARLWLWPRLLRPVCTSRRRTELKSEHAQLVAVVANRCAPGELEEVREALAPFGVPSWSLPEVPLLISPTMAELWRSNWSSPTSTPD